MPEKTSIPELEAHIADIASQVRAIVEQYDGREMTTEARAEVDALIEERDSALALKTDLEERANLLIKLSDKENNTEPERQFSFQTRRAGSLVPDDPTDYDEYSVRARSLEQLVQGRRDGAMKLIESRYRHEAADSQESAQNDAEKLARLDPEVADRFIITMHRDYDREFGTFLRTQGRITGPLMERAASLTTTAGGYAVPVELDTTLLLTNAGVINPIRNLARVRQTNANTVEFINTTGIVAGFGAEATEASDNAPTLAQPTINIEKAFAFVPMSIEIAEDWANIQQDMALCFADAKNQLESQKFLTGLGHASHEPQGLIAAGGATAVVTSASTATFALADVYSLSAALSPRYRANATIVGSRALFDKARQFNTAGSYGAWVDLAEGRPATLTGYPVAEWSSYTSAVTTTGSTVATIGDFNYFGIADRVGMNVEFIPHLFGGSNRFPTGQRGLYMYWRTSSQVLSPTIQANSAFVSLKLL